MCWGSTPRTENEHISTVGDEPDNRMFEGAYP